MSADQEPTTLPTVELLTRAADAAGKVAAEASQGERVIRIEGGTDATGEGWSQISVDFGPQDVGRHCGAMLGDTEDGELAEPDARLIAASGPDHWRAVEVLLRTVLTEHSPITIWADSRQLDSARVCKTCGGSDAYFEKSGQQAMRMAGHPCRTLNACRPLGEQVLRYLEQT